MAYKYFCGECGHRFESNLPERDANGLHNDIWCPECGGMNVYADTPEGAEQSAKDEIEYQVYLDAMNADND